MKRIAVYCGASKGRNEIYVKEAYQLGKYMAEQGYELVFGAGSVGIMGAIQDGVLDAGGHAIGVMPKMLDEKEITSQKVSELVLVDSMHERKNKMMNSQTPLSWHPVAPARLKNSLKCIVGLKLVFIRSPLPSLISTASLNRFNIC